MLDALGLNLKEIIFAMVNFLILVFVLGKFIYKPFLGMLENRKQMIQEKFDRANAVNKRADARMAKYNRQAPKRKAVKSFAMPSRRLKPRLRPSLTKQRQKLRKLSQRLKEQLRWSRQRQSRDCTMKSQNWHCWLLNRLLVTRLKMPVRKQLLTG